ncbi:hypothetical protein KVR01_008062 [Diaporthe batatas]|uniref:uncharacterized protein n=1 Tax=Diaporthe batatas TaxID=748121 RepID=UPI001D03AF71|nr:uncharacterized protein KVR01_008062 [Diaporthe batatas]KAG8162297.1 hypothetical protein KVR01_008062 [Diaporthe batatas]
MQLSFVLILLASTAGVMADLHKYALCTSKFQPIDNPNTCPKKRDVLDSGVLDLATSRIKGRGYGDNAAATKKACAAYRNRNTGNEQWDKCPDCTIGWRQSQDPTYCAITCNSNGEHIGGDEWLYYCKQAGADDSDAY